MNKPYIADINKFIKFHNIKNIYLDVDGVLWHSCQAVCDIINEKQGTDFTGDQIFSWNFKELCPTLTDKDVEEIFADPVFFQYVEWIDGALEFIKCHENNIKIVTKGTENNIYNKRLFFNLHGLRNVEIIGLSLSDSKSVVDMTGGLFIDDCTKNLEETNAKYKVQFLEYNDNKNELREWIKGFDGLKMYNW